MTATRNKLPKKKDIAEAAGYERTTIIKNYGQ
jgi:hypothetical protein